MMKKLIIAGMALSLLAGCTTLKRATGQIDDSVLPGQRSDILPPGQQVAPDPNVQGNQAVPPGGTVSQAPLAPGQAVAGNMPRANAQTTGNCDPKVDLCPEPLAPEPVAPISPVKPITPMATKDAAKLPAKGTKAATAVASTPAKTPPGTKPATVKVASKPPATAADAANGNLAAGQVLTDPNAPADATKKAAATTTDAAKTVVKKKKKKKKLAATAAAPVDPNAPADATAPAVPAAPAPQGQ